MLPGTRSLPESEAPSFCAIIAPCCGSLSSPPLIRIAEKLLRALGAREVIAKTGLVLLAAPSTPVLLSDDLGVALIGEVFPRGNVSPARIVAGLDAADAISAARCVSQNLWGRYVLVCAGEGGKSIAWFRDPSGSQCLYEWQCDSCTVLTDAITSPLMECLQNRPRIDWLKLSQLITQTEMASSFSALEHVDIVVPGQLQAVRNNRKTSHTIWSPVEFAEQCSRADDNEFRQTAARCVAHWISGHDKVTVELSGGLDSSLVAGLIAVSDRAPRIQGLNIIPRSPGGDESAYARSVSEKWGFGLIEAAIDPSELQYLDLLECSPTVEPAVYGLDVLADRLSSDLATAVGATRIFTGQGGDAVFFQPQTPLIASDYLRRAGPNSRFFELSRSCAKATNTSLWSVFKQAFRNDPTLERRQAPAEIAGPLTRTAWQGAGLVHPWLNASQELTAGKRMQIAMLANCQLFHRASNTSRHGRLVHPLLSQPLVELCLSTALWELVPDRRERGMVRDCFCEFLPPPVLHRRGKGEASGFYNRAIATHLPTLRPLLLDGVLAGKGLISPDTLSDILDVQHLLWKDDHPIIGSLVSLEIWARQWE